MTRCATCDRPATRTVREDELCDVCFDADYAPCGNCGEVVPQEDLVQFYGRECCVMCLPEDDSRYDAAREEGM